MAILKNKEIKNMGTQEREKRINELKLELIKSRGNSAKSGSTKIKEIKKTIARIITFSKSKKNEEKSSSEELNNK